MKLSQRIKVQHQTVQAHAQQVGHEWSRLNHGSRIATFCIVGGCSFLLLAGLNKMGFRRTRKLYAWGLLATRLKNQLMNPEMGQLNTD